MKKFTWLFFIIFILLAVKHYYTEWKMDKEFSKNISDSRSMIDPDADQETLQKGHVLVPSAPPLTEEWIRTYLKRNFPKKTDHFYTWRWHSDTTVTASARGVDNRHHFANSYLTGFTPFKTDSIWEPVYAVALMKTYQYDHSQYSGLTDVWQNTHQAFYFPRGDCEDHSIVLADWLIDAGYDARVAVGIYNGGGHAWVILFKNNTAYLLEATSKRKKITDTLRPAFLETDYNPSYQFNRKYFWIKTNKKYTTRYSGPHWKKTSTFVRATLKNN